MILDQLTSDLVSAMKAQDKFRIETLRFLLAAIKKYEIDTYPPVAQGKLTEGDVVKIVRQQVKTHKESIAAFTNAGRTDLTAKETAQLAILQNYLPRELSDDEIKDIVKSIKANGIFDFGQLMGLVMKEIAGRAEGERVARIVKQVV